jgi:hypothetical protein
MRDRDCYDDHDPWEHVRVTKEAIRARATLILYAAVASVPYIALVAAGAYLFGLMPHEVTGLACYHAMLSTIFFFDTIRNAAHDCFDQAMAGGFVSITRGLPVIDPSFPHRRLARLSFAIGGRDPREE